MQQKCAVYVDGVEIANDVSLCETSSSRRKGLLGRGSITVSQGVLMNVPGVQKYLTGYWNSIHMVGMKFPISVAWIDKNNKIIRACRAEPQGGWGVFFPRLYSSRKPACYILELHVDNLERLKPGSIVQWNVLGS